MKKILFALSVVLCVAGVNSEIIAQNDYYKSDSVSTKPERRSTPEPKENQRTSSINDESDLKTLRFKERIRLGGNFGLAIGTFTNINISPMAGYQVTDKFVAGAGLTYMFFRNSTLAIQKNSHLYGGKLFAMYSILPVLNVVGEYEALSVTYFDYKKSNFPYKSRTWLGSPLVGLSYVQPIGGGRLMRGAHISLLYNLNYNQQVNPSVNYLSTPENISPYSSPFVIRVSFL